MVWGPEDDRDVVRILRACDSFYPDLLKKLDHSKMFVPPLSWRGRVKREESVKEKVSKRAGRRPPYVLKNVTDLIGIRFITLTRMGIADVVDGVLTLLNKPPTDDPGDFASADFKEFKQFIAPPPRLKTKSSEPEDLLYDKLKALLAEHYPDGSPTRLEYESRPQYSGVHIVLMFPFEHERHSFTVPVEIQIRSVFEEAWGELDHLLFYKDPARRRAVTRHLGILKRLLDTAADYAEAISEMDASGSDTPPDTLPSLVGHPYIEQLAKPIIHRREIFDEFIHLVKGKEKFDSELASEDRYFDFVDNEYLGFAEKLKALFETEFVRLDPEDFPEDQRDRVRTLVFLVRMEQAINLFLAATDATVRQAVALYDEVTSQTIFPGLEGGKYPLAWYRMGEAKAWLLEFSRHDVDEREALAKGAFEAFGKARETLPKEDKDDRFIIAPWQRVYMDANIERMQGFVLWRLSDLRREVNHRQAQPADLRDVRAAWEVVKPRVESMTTPFTEASLNLFNTATYFATDGLRLCAELGEATTGFPSHGELRQMLDTLEDQMTELQSVDEKFSHTKMFGYLYLQDATRATDAAEEVMDAHVQFDPRRPSPYQKDMHERVAREAWPLAKSKRRDPPDGAKK